MSTMFHCLTFFILPISKLILSARSSREPESPSECVFCLCQIRQGEATRTELRCRHVFHMRCLDRWVENGGRTCPLCRDRLPAVKPGRRTAEAEADRVEQWGRWRGERPVAFSAFGGFGLEDNWWIRLYS